MTEHAIPAPGATASGRADGAALEVEGLVVRYGDLVAVDGLSVRAAAGEVLGLLGPNGAGKTTTIACLTGLVVPAAGELRVLGRDVVGGGPEARRPLGVVPQELALYEELSARENLRFFGRVHGLRGADLDARVDAVLERVGLADRAREPASRFSGGMKRRLNLACGVVHRPRVLLLDEPTAGVDPQSRARLLELVREEARAGACVFYTTHYMEEAEALCDRIAVVDHGRLVAEGTLEELRARLGGRDLLRVSGTFEPARVRAALGRLDGDVELLQAEPTLVALSAADASRRLPELFAALAEAGAEVRETTLARPSLETLFLALTGRELRE